MNVESRLKELIGEPAGRLHTARSRNDQVATDFKLYVRDWIDGADAALAALQLALARKAEAHCDTGHAGLHASAAGAARHLRPSSAGLRRDARRATAAGSPMRGRGSTSARWARPRWPAPRSRSTGTRRPKALGFDRPTANSLDAVADRDFALETLAAAAIAAMHLSRFAEEIVIWMTPQFGFMRLSDKFTTGSSIMPQKRNPDAAELVRAKVGRIAAAFQALLMVMKGLPLAYSKDMQEDKEATFDALASLRLAIAAMTGMVDDLEPNGDAMRAAAGGGYSTATDLADWLVRALGLPFREAHHVTGRIVAAAEARGVPLDKLPLAAMQAVEPAHHGGRVFGAFGAELGQEPHQLWGNCATERAQNGASLDKAVGKGRRKGLEIGIAGLGATGCFGGRLALRTCEQGSTRLRCAADCSLAW